MGICFESVGLSAVGLVVSGSCFDSVGNGDIMSTDYMMYNVIVLGAIAGLVSFASPGPLATWQVYTYYVDYYLQIWFHTSGCMRSNLTSANQRYHCMQ